MDKRLAISIILCLGAVAILAPSVSSGTADKQSAGKITPAAQDAPPAKTGKPAGTEAKDKDKDGGAGDEDDADGGVEQLQLEGYRKQMEKSIRKRFGTAWGPIILLTLTDKGTVKTTEFLAKTGKPAVDEAARSAIAGNKYQPLPAPWKVKEITFCIDLSR